MQKFFTIGDAVVGARRLLRFHRALPQEVKQILAVKCPVLEAILDTLDNMVDQKASQTIVPGNPEFVGMQAQQLNAVHARIEGMYMTLEKLLGEFDEFSDLFTIVNEVVDAASDIMAMQPQPFNAE